MWNAFMIVDNFQFEKIFERFARWAQKTTGITCFNLAEYVFKFSWLSSLVVTACMAYLIFPESYVFAGVLVMLEIDMARSRIRRIREVKQLDEMYASGGSLFMNELRLTMMPARIMSMIATPLLVCLYAYIGMPKFVLLYACFYFFGEHAAIYLMACTPMPPCKGTVREWFNSFGRQFRTAKATN